jgi:hypothetical protein
MTPLQQTALKVLATLEQRTRRYNAINDGLRSLQGDFCSYVPMCDHLIQEQVVKLLDEILGDELASYYLYDCRMSENGGAFHEDGKEYRFRVIEDIEAYLRRKP